MPKPGYWSDPKVLEDHARKRRDKYATDPEVRAAEKKRARQAYLDRIGEAHVNPARDALKAGVFKPGEQYSALDISTAIGRAPPYVSRLINRGLWPDPRTSKSVTACFDGETVVRLVEVLADHVDEIATTYRADHIETREKLFAAMTAKETHA